MVADAYHVIIVGGSFSGLAAAVQLGRARRRVLVVDAGSPRNRFAHASHGFPGQDGRSPAQILETFRAEVLAYPTTVYRTAEATAASRIGDDQFVVTLSSGTTERAQRLILAGGVIDELPAVPGLAERWGATVVHCPYCHGYEVADRRLGVLAISERAIHQAMLLPDWSADVTLFTNGVVAPDAEQRAALHSRGVHIEEASVQALEGAAPTLDGVRLMDGRMIAIDALFITPRTRVASPLAEQLGCAFDDGPSGSFVRTDARRETTVPGVYCAGDVARASHNAPWAASDGVTAGISVHQSLIAAPKP